MRWKAVLLVLFTVFFAGCSNASNPIDNAVSLRNQILTSDSCSFRITVNADYGTAVYTFSMDCTSDKEGNLSFCVTAPETIAGITGNISSQGGAITFEDKILAFQTLADGELSPVTAPWVFLNTLRSGYIRACTAGDSEYKIEFDDSYKDKALRLNVLIENDLPVGGEIFWQGRRAISFTVENFTYM